MPILTNILSTWMIKKPTSFILVLSLILFTQHKIFLLSLKLMRTIALIIILFFILLHKKFF